MSPDPLPACRHRGEQLLPDRWLCHSDRLVLRTGLVSGDTCRTRCPYVDHDGGTRPTPGAPGVTVEPRPELLSVGVITAPRPLSTLPQTLAELRRAGFPQPVRVFAEPGAPVPADPSLVVCRNATRLGLWGNWRAAAHHLLAETDTPFVLLCEDDVRFARCAAPALQHAMDTLPRRGWGYASLYTPRRNLNWTDGACGWRPFAVGAGTWGALAWCFTRAGLAALLDSKAVRGHAHPEGTDTVVSLAANELGLTCYTHAPSLADHTGGDNSTHGHRHFGGAALGVGFAAEYAGYRPARADLGRVRIPKVIHQVWLGPEPPPVALLRSWAERHPGWEYRLWTEHTRPRPLRNEAQFNAAPRLCGKADILRYEVLLAHGGVYADADMRSLRPFTDDDRRHAFFSVYEDEGRRPGLVNNCLIGCEPGSPVIAAAVDAVARLTPRELAETPAWVATGPTLLTKCLEGASGAHIFPSAEFVPVHFRADAVDRARLAGARAVHYFGSSPASAEFAAFREPAEPADGFHDELTVVVQTSSVPCHPSLQMLDRSVASLKLLGGRPRFMFLYDGPQGTPDERTRYAEYKRRAKAQFPGAHWEAAEWMNSGGCLRRALDRVGTPFLLYWEHDWELSRPVDTAGILRALAADESIGTIRLNKRTTLEAPGDLALRERPGAAVPLVATPCWSANPHFARTARYREFVLPTCLDGVPLEIPLYEEALRVYHARGLPEQHAAWGSCILGRVGDAATVAHLDGRAFVPDPARE